MRLRAVALPDEVGHHVGGHGGGGSLNGAILHIIRGAEHDEIATGEAPLEDARGPVAKSDLDGDIIASPCDGDVAQVVAVCSRFKDELLTCLEGEDRFASEGVRTLPGTACVADLGCDGRRQRSRR